MAFGKFDLSFVDWYMFFNNRMKQVGIKSINDKMPKPGVQGPEGDILWKKKIIAVALA